MPLRFLDFALPAILILFLPLGFWRGVQRELVVSVGILLASVTTLLWTPTWVRELANTFKADVALLQLGVQIGGFTAITLIVGYGSSLLPIRFSNGSSWLRGVGALVGLLNGTLIASFILQFIYFYFAALNIQPNPIAISPVAWRLANWAGWFYLDLALLLTIAVATSALYRIVVALARLARRPAPAPLAPSSTPETAIGSGTSDGSSPDRT